MFSSYHAGTVPLEIDRLQRSVTSGATAIAVLLSIKAEVPSGLVALVVSKLESSYSLMMSSSVHSMLLGHSLWETVIISPTVRGATEVLNDLLRRSAFVWSANAITCTVCLQSGNTGGFLVKASYIFPEVLTA